MQHLRRFLLSAIFLLIPIIYASWYIPGIPGNLASWLHVSWRGFESVKSSLFVDLSLLLLVTNLVMIFVDFSRIKISKKIFLGVGIGIVWFVLSYLTNTYVNPYFIDGEPQKGHGIFFFLSLILLYFNLRDSTLHEQKKYLGMTFIGFGIVLLYAIFQKLGIDPMRVNYSAPIELTRLFSTLGNPNYLAGYILILLPIFLQVKQKAESRKQKWDGIFIIGSLIIFGFLIFWTESYLAWILYSLYLLFLLASQIFTTKKSQKYLFFTVAGLAVLVVIFVCIHFQDLMHLGKFRNFISRFYLWGAGISALIHDLPHFIFGYGPDGFLAVSDMFRSPTLAIPGVSIDSSHNVFIDSALVFGLPIAVIFWMFVFRRFTTLPQMYQVSLCLFAVYFAFNIPVLVHFLVLVQILSLTREHAPLSVRE